MMSYTMSYMMRSHQDICQMIQKYAQNRSSMLRSRDKWLFVFWPYDKHCFWHVCMTIFGNIFGNIFGKISDYRNKPNFGISVRVENVTKYLSFGYRFSQYNFAKLYRSSKALPKRMALLITKWSC